MHTDYLSSPARLTLVPARRIGTTILTSADNEWLTLVIEFQISIFSSDRQMNATIVFSVKFRLKWRQSFWSNIKENRSKNTFVDLIVWEWKTDAALTLQRHRLARKLFLTFVSLVVNQFQWFKVYYNQWLLVNLMRITICLKFRDYFLINRSSRSYLRIRSIWEVCFHLLSLWTDRKSESALWFSENLCWHIFFSPVLFLERRVKAEQEDTLCTRSCGIVKWSPRSFFPNDSYWCGQTDSNPLPPDR